MNQWFRMYHGVLDDPKVQRLSPPLFKFWVNILCLASRNDGRLPDTEGISFALRLSISKSEALISELLSIGLIDSDVAGMKPHNWEFRQFRSDGSTERVKRFRKRSETVDETPTATGPDSDTEQIQNRTETEKKKPLAISSPVVPKYPADFELFWQRSTQRGSKLSALKAWMKLKPDPELLNLVSAGMSAWQKSEQWQDETKQPHISTWLNRRGWEEIVPNGNGKMKAIHVHSERCKDYGFCPEAR